MDTLRGHFRDEPQGNADGMADTLDLSGYETSLIDSSEPDGCQAPPPAIGQDERRMQVRAYNLWAQLLGDGNYPLMADFDPRSNPDFGPNSVVLDFSTGIENPAVTHVGESLARECGIDTLKGVDRLSDVPGHSLLSRITDHYVQMLSNQTPIGFEAEFFNYQGHMILYRGILLPFSADGHSIDYIYGVLNWKELADDETNTMLNGALRTAMPTPAPRQPALTRPSLAEPVAERLRAMTPKGFDDINDDGPEFALLMARRMSSGNVVLLAEVADDPAMVEKVARRILPD